MVLIQLARRWIMAITFFGDGHGDNSRLAVGDQRWADQRIIASIDDVSHRADDLDVLVFVIARGKRVEKVLRPESISDGCTAKADPANSPRRIPGDRILRRLAHRALRVIGHMRAVECTDAEVNDARRQLSGIERRTSNGRMQPIQGRRIEYVHRLGRSLWLKRLIRSLEIGS